MKKTVLAMMLGVMSIGSANAIDLGSGRLLFKGKLNQAGCTVSGTSGHNGDATIAMPGNLGIGEVKPLTANTAVGWNTLSQATKYNDGDSLGFNLSIACPSSDIYTYIAGILGGSPTVDLSTFQSNAKLYLYGAGNGASGFIPAANSGSAVGVLAADAVSPNRSVGILVWHLNSPGGEKAIDLDGGMAASGVGVDLAWEETATSVRSNAQLQFAYVPASSAANSVKGGITTATLPFRFEYR